MKKSPLKAADPTLVQAAFREAMAKVPRYDREAVKTEAGLGGQVMAGVERGIKSYQEDIKAEELELKKEEEKEEKKIKEQHKREETQLNGFRTIADAFRRKMAADGGLHKSVFNTMNVKVRKLREEYLKYNKVGDEDTAENREMRADVLGRLDKVVNGVYGTRSILQETVATSDELSIASGGDNLDIYNAILNDGSGGSYETKNEFGQMGVTPRHDENDELVYDVLLPDTHTDGSKWGGIDPETGIGMIKTVTQADLASMIFPEATVERSKLIDLSGTGEEGKITLLAKHHAQNEPWKAFPEQDHEDSIYNAIVDPEEGGKPKNLDQVVADLCQSKLWGNPGKGYGKDGGPALEGEVYKYDLGSFGQALVHAPFLDYGFYEDLAEDKLLNIEDVDNIDKDGIITEEEVRKFYAMDTKNKNMVIDAMVDHTDDNFDAKRSARAFSHWRMLQDKGNYDIALEGEKTKLEGGPKTPGTKKPGTPPEKDTYYRLYEEVPDAANPGEIIKISPQNQAKTYKNIQDKTPAFQAAQGYYARLKGGKYLRYNTRADYIKDNEDGKLSSSEATWKKTFGKDAEWNVERYIDETRLIELEASTRGTPKAR
jgi:hypothetical protein